MSADTVDRPAPAQTNPEPAPLEQEKPLGIANSFSDSQRRRNRKPPTSPNAAGSSQSAPTPLPKRPKGRFFVGAFLLLLIGGGIVTVWQAFFSVVGRGIVEARNLTITPAETGFIRTIHVRDGALVQQGDPLITIEKVNQVQDVRQRLQDELDAAIYDFKIELAKHRVNASLSNNQKAKARAEYLHWLGELLQEQSKLDDLIDQQRRNRLLSQKQSVGAAKLRSIEFELQGQRAKVQKLALAVEQLEKNAASIESDVDFTDLIHAHQERIAILRQKLDRQGEATADLVIRAPVTGVVNRICRFTGERIAPGEPLVQLLESGSIRPVLYLAQQQADGLSVGDPVVISVRPGKDLIACTVERIGIAYQESPESIEKGAGNNNRVIPVYLVPDNPAMARDRLRPGCLIELPHRFSWSRVFGNRPGSPLNKRSENDPHS